jgi:hypothetical protein
MSFQSMLLRKQANTVFIHNNKWWQWQWLMVSRAVVVAVSMTMAVVVMVMMVAVVMAAVVVARVRAVASAVAVAVAVVVVEMMAAVAMAAVACHYRPAVRPLLSIFHCCFHLSVDCCVCFPNVILTKPSTSNNTRLHMDHFSSFSLGATMPHAE